MKIGIVGTGSIVKELLPLINQIPEIECAAIYGTPRSKDIVTAFCNQYHINHGFTDYEQLLASEIDTVYVAVPNHLHYEFCLEALKANKNVIVEKPMTSNYKEAQYLSNLAQKKNLFLYEAITTLYLPNYKLIQELLPQIGTVKLIECNFSQYSRRYDAFREGEILPVFDPAKSGGTLMDINIYNLHYVIGLFGTPDGVEYHANMERGIDTSGILTMSYPDFQAVCIAAKDSAAPGRAIIQGTKGYLLQETTTSVCGPVILHLNDGTQLVFNDNKDRHRMMDEFIEFAKQIDTGNLLSCYQQLEHSLSIMKVATEARYFAGICFLADDIEI